MKLLQETRSRTRLVETVVKQRPCRGGGNPLMEFNHFRFREPTPFEDVMAMMEDREPNPPYRLLPLARLDAVNPGPLDVVVRLKGRAVARFPSDWIWMMEPATNRLILRAPNADRPARIFEAGEWDLVK